MSLTVEINRRRIERARHLLLLPDISVAEVAYQVAWRARRSSHVCSAGSAARRRRHIGPATCGARGASPPAVRRFALELTRPQSRRASASADTSHEPPTHSTFARRRYSGAFAALMPPVAQKRAWGRAAEALAAYRCRRRLWLEKT